MGRVALARSPLKWKRRGQKWGRNNAVDEVCFKICVFVLCNAPVNEKTSVN